MHSLISFFNVNFSDAIGGVSSNASESQQKRSKNDWLEQTHEAGAASGFLFGPYVAPIVVDDTLSAKKKRKTTIPDAEPTQKTWDRKSTVVPEVPNLMGDGGADSGLETLRIIALGKNEGNVIDLWQGDVITLVVSGRGPMNGKTISLVVDDVIYGDKAYINMLVDGGTALSGGGRSRAQRSAYVRVVEK